jgi:hypothetical protein
VMTTANAKHTRKLGILVKNKLYALMHDQGKQKVTVVFLEYVHCRTGFNKPIGRTLWERSNNTKE